MPDREQLFVNPRRVAFWSIIGGLANTAACARALFIHEYAVGAWLGLLSLMMVLQFSVAGHDAEREKRDN